MLSALYISQLTPDTLELYSSWSSKLTGYAKLSFWLSYSVRPCHLFYDKNSTKICTPTGFIDPIIKELVECQTQTFLAAFYPIIIWQWINSLVWVSELGQPGRSLVISYDVVFAQRKAQLCQILIGDSQWRLKAANLYLHWIPWSEQPTQHGK